MVAACATCHLLIRDGLATLSEAGDKENDQLNNAYTLETCSRPACSVRLDLGNIKAEPPKRAREKCAFSVWLGPV